MQHTQEVPTYEMPPMLYHTKEAQPLGQVCTIKGFLKSCVKLLNDPSYVKMLQNILEGYSTEVGGNLEQKTIHHLQTRRRTSKQF
jgi:hypothetical protein